jgi:hypothetical protein
MDELVQGYANSNLRHPQGDRYKQHKHINMAAPQIFRASLLSKERN